MPPYSLENPGDSYATSITFLLYRLSSFDINLYPGCTKTMFNGRRMAMRSNKKVVRQKLLMNTRRLLSSLLDSPFHLIITKSNRQPKYVSENMIVSSSLITPACIVHWFLDTPCMMEDFTSYSTPCYKSQTESSIKDIHYRRTMFTSNQRDTCAAVSTPCDSAKAEGAMISLSRTTSLKKVKLIKKLVLYSFYFERVSQAY